MPRLAQRSANISARASPASRIAAPPQTWAAKSRYRRRIVAPLLPCFRAAGKIVCVIAFRGRLGS